MNIDYSCSGVWPQLEPEDIPQRALHILFADKQEDSTYKVVTMAPSICSFMDETGSSPYSRWSVTP